MSDYGKESRQVELDGISKLKEYFGSTATVVDLGHTDGYDFEIHYSDGKKAIGEFSWLAEPKSYEMWKAIHKREEPQQISLPEGWGYWGLTLNKPININVLENLTPKWITEVLETGQDHIELYEGWPNTEFARRLRGYGITRIYKFSDDVDKVFYMVMGEAGAVPWDLTPLRETILFLLQENEIVRSNFLKLVGLKADEKHVYLGLGDLVPNLQTWALLTEREPVEIPELDFPDEISHIWLDSGSEQIRNILWERGRKPRYF